MSIRQLHMDDLHVSKQTNTFSAGFDTDQQNRTKLECGPMPNVMAVLPNIGGALCLTPQSLADAHY